MRTFLPLAVALLLALSAVASFAQSALASSAQDSAPGHLLYRTFSFTTWPSPAWRMVREARFPAVGRFVPVTEGIANFIPQGADEKDVAAAKGGLGVASAVVCDTRVWDCTVLARLAFEAKGAPAILLRTQVHGCVTGDTLSLVVYQGGVILWRLAGDKWSKVAAAEMPVAEQQTHHVRVVLAGPSAKVWLDGKRVLEVADVGLAEAGAIGIWAGEGPCRFEALRFSCSLTSPPPVAPTPPTKVLELAD